MGQKALSARHERSRLAVRLSGALKEKSVSLTHSESLELIAKVLGLADRNTLSARIDASPKAGPAVTLTVRKPVVPMRDLVLFPDMTTPIYAARPKSLAAIEQAMAADKELLFVAQRRAADDDPGSGDLYAIGVVARPLDIAKMPDGSIKMLVQGLRRARVTRIDTQGGCPGGRARALAILPHLQNPGRIADMIARYLSLTFGQRQHLLETTSCSGWRRPWR